MAHQWKFFRAGGFEQVRIDTGADIAHLGELDPKLWVALSCPTKGLELDAHTLELLDSDKDGRIRVPEVLAAAGWTSALLNNPDGLMKGAAELPLDAINTGSDEGKQVLASAKQLLSNLGKGDAKSISPADVGDTVRIFSKTLFNGDGIIPAVAAQADAQTQRAIEDIISCVGSTQDLSGLEGIDQTRLDRFFLEAEAFLAWSKQIDASADPEAFAAYKAVKAKVDDFFARCALASMDGRAAGPLNPSDSEYTALAGSALSATHAQLAAMPIAKIEAGRPLPLAEGLNPAWAAPMASFRERCLKPLIGDASSLSAAQWATVGARLAPHEKWHATKPIGSVEKLGAARLTELTRGPTKAAIDALMAKDKALAPELKAITSVDRLTHFHRDLALFLNNFVAFRDFYTRAGKATFQAGTLYLDGRSCELCIRVDDPARHGALASLSMAYLAYCDLTRKGSSEKLQIVAAFTGGDSDFLIVGRNGVFYDRKGQDWDATIVKLVEQPISVRQAFWLPYKRVAKFIEDQANAFAGAKDKESHALTTADAKATAFDIGKFAGVFAALGLAVGMIGSALAAIFSGFLGLEAQLMPLALLGALIVISGPSMLLAAMKLRKRSLGPLLDASGWAVNARVNINIPFGASLTHLAVVPPGSKRSVSDPYAQKRPVWPVAAALLALAGVLLWLWSEGRLDQLIALAH
jgi:hypothetical protein